MKGSDVCLIIVALIFPPATAAFITGCSCDLLINILLTMLGYIPGCLHAFWLVYRRMEAEERYGQGAYHYVSGGQFEPTYAQQGAPSGGAPPPPPPPANYGATQ